VALRAKHQSFIAQILQPGVANLPPARPRLSFIVFDRRLKSNRAVGFSTVKYNYWNWMDAGCFMLSVSRRPSADRLLVPSWTSFSLYFARVRHL